MVSFDIKGYAAPVFTPFDHEGNVNLEIIPRYADYLFKNDIETVLVGGTTGEFMTLSLEERKNIVAAWLEAAKPCQINVIVQVGGAPLTEVIQLAQFAEAHKADAIMSLPERYIKPKSAEDIVNYLKVISENAPSLPLLYYHFPMMSGVDVNIPEFFTLASSKIKNFKGIKADLMDASQIGHLLGVDQKVFIGNHCLAPAILLGHYSSIATVTNVFPTLVRNIFNSARASDVSRAKALQEEMNSLVDAITIEGDFVPAMKAAMRAVTGLDLGHPRFPFKPLSTTAFNRLQEKLQNYLHIMVSNV